MRTTLRLAIVTLSACVLPLAGCVTSDVMLGTPRPAISETAVKEYVTRPAQYDEIARIYADSKMSLALSDQGKIEAAIEVLKRKAAGYGANGILVQSLYTDSEMVDDPHHHASSPALKPDGSIDTSAPPPSPPRKVRREYKSASAIAIYVKEEPTSDL